MMPGLRKSLVEKGFVQKEKFSWDENSATALDECGEGVAVNSIQSQFSARHPERTCPDRKHRESKGERINE